MTGYPVRAAARMSGLGIDTLRAWERRHRAVAPRRDGRGRLYTDADVRRLRLLREAVGRGHSIGRIAKMDDKQLARLGATDGALAAAPGSARRATSDSPAFDAGSLSVLAARFDSTALDAALSRAAALLPLDDLLRQVAGPLLGTGPFARAAVRNLLGAVLRLRPPATLPGRLLLATGGASGEIELLQTALLAARGGLDVIYLGTGVVPAHLLEAAMRSEADVVILSVDDDGEAAMELASRLPRDVELWLTGAGARRASGTIGSRAANVADATDLEAQLSRLGARI